jgi:2-polyprenyl-6-methoxyphenol hydroxylase-like FAD-dependent oxidoreductase
MAKLRVLIAGAGLGGLCLAQSLRQHDVDVEVFERDTSLWDRPQGYRLHIDSDGVNALHQSLTPELYQLFDATSMKPLPFTTLVDTKLAIQNRLPSDEHGSTQGDSPDELPSHLNVNRATLRQILFTDLEDIVHFGKKLSQYESDEQGVTVTFEDGTTATGDLLVGADGIRSKVRKQRVPHADTQDTGVRAIYGRIPMPEAMKYVPHQAREDVFTIAVDSQKLFLGLGPVVFPTRPDVAASHFIPQAELRSQDDYVVCIVGGRKELFGRDNSRLRAFRSEDLQTLSVELMQEWPESARAIPAHGDPTSFFFVEMYTSIPCEMPKSANVTLLGDAIHAMTPTLGRGANIAMRDGALLGRHLEEVVHGGRTLSEALREYETEMTQYGFDVVKKSAMMGTRLMGQNPLPEGS